MSRHTTTTTTAIAIAMELQKTPVTFRMHGQKWKHCILKTLELLALRKLVLIKIIILFTRIIMHVCAVDACVCIETVASQTTDSCDSSRAVPTTRAMWAREFWLCQLMYWNGVRLVYWLWINDFLIISNTWLTHRAKFWWMIFAKRGNMNAHQNTHVTYHFPHTLSQLLADCH